MKHLSIKKMFILTIMSVLACSQLNAQLVDVVPGSKGNLPAPPELQKAAEAHFGALCVRNVCLESEYMFSYYRYFLVAELQYPDASTFGGDSYTIQYHEAGSNEWKNVPKAYLYYTHPVSVGKQSFTAAQIDIEKEETKSWPITFRLVLNGGPMDGYLSNEVVAERPFLANLRVGIGYTQPSFIYAGYRVASHTVDAWRVPDTSKGEKADKRWIEIPRQNLTTSYRWYIRNPNTYEMTLIEGATDYRYTPTVDQVGYELISQIIGSYNNTTFKTTHCEGLIMLPILASAEYQGKDGFILNTEYILPNPEKDFYMIDWLNEESGRKALPNIKTLKPGQYSVHMNLDEYMSNYLCYGESPYILSMWSRHWDGYHEFAFIGAESFPIRINVQKDGKDISLASVDIIGKDIEGKLSVLETISASAESDTITTDLLAGSYLFKAHATDGTMDTYYPDAAIWNEAKTIKLTSDKYWNLYSDDDFAFTIGLQPTLAALTGNCTISGTVVIASDAAQTRASGEAESYTVYLKDKASSSIVASTTTDGSGKYTFQNVPIGEYIVVPDLVGFKAESSEDLSASVTQQNQIVNLDCLLQATTEFPPIDGVVPGDANGDGDVTSEDITEVAGYIMGEWSYMFNEDNADANGDKVINIADIVEIVNIIKKKSE